MVLVVHKSIRHRGIITVLAIMVVEHPTPTATTIPIRMYLALEHSSVENTKFPHAVVLDAHLVLGVADFRDSPVMEATTIPIPMVAPTTITARATLPTLLRATRNKRISADTICVE